MTEKYLGKYDFQMYAMDKYGNLFIETVGGRKDYVSYSSRDGYTVKTSEAPSASHKHNLYKYSLA